MFSRFFVLKLENILFIIMRYLSVIFPILMYTMKKTMLTRDVVPFQSFGYFFLQKADAGTMRYHLAVFAIFRVETREQVMHESCGTISSFCQF